MFLRLCALLMISACLGACAATGQAPAEPRQAQAPEPQPRQPMSVSRAKGFGAASAFLR